MKPPRKGREQPTFEAGQVQAIALRAAPQYVGHRLQVAHCRAGGGNALCQCSVRYQPLSDAGDSQKGLLDSSRSLHLDRALF